MADRFAQVQDALAEALANGWETCPGKPDTLRRIVEHRTPDHARAAGWWPRETYDSVEFLTFVFTERNRIPKVIHGYSRCPWITLCDTKISFKRSLELLAQPVADSKIHN